MRKLVVAGCIGVLTVLLGLWVYLWRLQSPQAESAKAFTEKQPYISPDGKWALVQDLKEDGVVILLSTARNQVVRRFDSQYVVPADGTPWLLDSRHFLLEYTHEGKLEYRLFHVNRVSAVRTFSVSEGELPRVIMSPDGRYAVAEFQDTPRYITRLLIWDMQTSSPPTAIDFGKTDISKIIWVPPSYTLVVSGAKNPKLFLVEVQRCEVKQVPMNGFGSAQPPFSFPVVVPSVEEVPLLARQGKEGAQTLLVLDLRAMRLKKQVPLPRISESDWRKGYRWLWLPAAGCYVLYRAVEPEGVELILYDNEDVGSPIRLSGTNRFTVDTLGRVWIWDGSRMKIVEHLLK